MMNRAFSMIEVKSLDETMRKFSGMATTPTADRMSDTINPMGATFKNPLVLLHQHNHESPIGTVMFGKPTAKGISFDAMIPMIAEPGMLKDRVDMAWGEIKHGLVRAVSIGFIPTKFAFLKDGGIDYQEIEILELSAVSVPANAEATITQVKAFDAAARLLAGIPDPPIPVDPALAATGKSTRVVKLDMPIRGATPYEIKSILRT